MKLYYSYLGPQILSGFDSYKYSSKDTSPLSNYVMHPFWNQVKIISRHDDKASNYFDTFRQ